MSAGETSAGATSTSDAALTSLLGKVRRLELAARRNAAGMLLGEYRTAIPGRGLIFREARRYVAGDPVRDIAWTITARVGEPYVKVFQEERQRDVVVAVDVSPSMHTGFARRTKLELAVELAATLAVSAIDAGDRLGAILFADVVLAEHRPRAGRAQLFRVLRTLLEHAEPWDRPVLASDPRVALHALEHSRRGRYVAFLISDFIDHDIPEDLEYVRARHDISLLHIYDPAEHADGAEVVFGGYAPEGRPSRGVTAPGIGGDLGSASLFLRDHAARRRVATASFSTADPVGPGLGHFFHRKRRRRG